MARGARKKSAQHHSIGTLRLTAKTHCHPRDLLYPFRERLESACIPQELDLAAADRQVSSPIRRLMRLFDCVSAREMAFSLSGGSCGRATEHFPPADPIAKKVSDVIGSKLPWKKCRA